MKITEETDVVYSLDTDLSYDYMDEDNVFLFIRNKYRGYCEIWYDAEINKRPYIILNYSIIYLDTLRKHDKKG